MAIDVTRSLVLAVAMLCGSLAAPPVAAEPPSRAAEATTALLEAFDEARPGDSVIVDARHEYVDHDAHELILAFQEDAARRHIDVHLLGDALEQTWVAPPQQGVGAAPQGGGAVPRGSGAQERGGGAQAPPA